MARTDPQVNFRIPESLLERIKAAAAESNRTVTAELVSRLESSFNGTGAGPESSVLRLTEAWTSVQEHVQFISEEVAALEQLSARTHHEDFNENRQPPGWKPPAPLPEWASLEEAMAFYRSWRDSARDELDKISKKLFFTMGVVLPTKKQPTVRKKKP